MLSQGTVEPNDLWEKSSKKKVLLCRKIMSKFWSKVVCVSYAFCDTMTNKGRSSQIATPISSLATFFGAAKMFMYFCMSFAEWFCTNQTSLNSFCRCKTLLVFLFKKIYSKFFLLVFECILLRCTFCQRIWKNNFFVSILPATRSGESLHWRSALTLELIPTRWSYWILLI